MILFLAGGALLFYSIKRTIELRTEAKIEKEFAWLDKLIKERGNNEFQISNRSGNEKTGTLLSPPEDSVTCSMEDAGYEKHEGDLPIRL